MLLIACVNVAGVQLVRGTAKANEVAIRTALGANRWSLLRPSLAEGALLSAAGGGVGLGLAMLSVALLRSWHPTDYPMLADVRVDGRTVAYAGRVTLNETRYHSREAVTAFYSRPTARLRAIPGVTAAGAALGVPVRMGRNFTDADTRPGVIVAIIDEEVARVFFPGINPIGQRITGQVDTATIVGVVASVGFHELGHARKATIYYPLAQNTAWSMQVVVRTATDLQHPAVFLQSAVSELDHDVPVTHVGSMA